MILEVELDGLFLIRQSTGIDMNISALNNTLSSMTNSYKYLFLRSLMNLLKESYFKKDTFSYKEINIEMLAISWRISLFFRLDFGSQDQISKYLKLALEKNSNHDKLIELTDKKKIKECLEKLDYNNSKGILKYVPQRILRGFFSNEVYGLPDHKVDKKILELCNRPDSSSLFAIDRSLVNTNTHTPNNFEETRVVLNKKWINYFKNNMSILEGWAERHWIDYLATKNPFMPNISSKIKFSSKRNLTKERAIWKGFISEREVMCVFSKRPLDIENFSLDHFIPFQFSGHNLLWNLVPVAHSFSNDDYLNPNSSKNNKLPHPKYIKPFISCQLDFLNYLECKKSKIAYRNLLKDYEIFLNIDIKNNDTKSIYKKYYEEIENQIRLAASHGFLSNWEYKKHKQSKGIG